MTEKQLTPRQYLRHQVRQYRQQLSPEQQQQSATQLLHQLQNNDAISNSQHIAVYLANDGEINTQPFIEWLWQQEKCVYLPVLHPFSQGHLLFLRYTPETPMALNRYKILEPSLDIRLVKPANELDIICTPLVAFDSSGQRLGMGGGYYDRTLQRWHTERKGPQPIGLAHDCQRVDLLPSEAWDVPLTQIITPSASFQW